MVKLKTVSALFIGLAFLVMAAGQETAPDSAQGSCARRERLKNARTWMYQIQGIDQDGAVDVLANSAFDLLVVEPMNTVKGNEDWDSRGAVKRLKANHPLRLVLAYVNIGEAESYRTYWRDTWQPPSKIKPGQPNFIMTADPDGWEENYPVAFWDKRWYDVIIDGKESLLKRVLADGYDGIYLDWVEAYDEAGVRQAAHRQGVDPSKEMVDFILHLRATAHECDPEFLVVAQNAPYLLDLDPRYATALDAVAFEDTWFRGKANSVWDDTNGGDIPNKHRDVYGTPRLVEQYKKYLKLGLPVFTCDYCLKKDHAATVDRASRKEGFVPLVTQISLSRMTATPSLDKDRVSPSK